MVARMVCEIVVVLGEVSEVCLDDGFRFLVAAGYSVFGENR